MTQRPHGFRRKPLIGAVMIGVAVTVMVGVVVIAPGDGQSHSGAVNNATPEPSLDTHSDDTQGRNANRYRMLYYWRGALMRPAPSVCAGCSKLGMIVTRVTPASSTARAGLRPGDVVTSLDGMDTSTPRHLAMAVADHPIGPKIELQVWRDGRSSAIAVPVAPSS